MTAPQAATFLGVTRGTVYAWIRLSRLAARKMAKAWFVDDADVERFRREHTLPNGRVGFRHAAKHPRRHGREFMREMGKKGGRANVERGVDFAARGAHGGMATLAKHGREHFVISGLK